MWTWTELPLDSDEVIARLGIWYRRALSVGDMPKVPNSILFYRLLNEPPHANEFEVLRANLSNSKRSVTSPHLTR